MDEIKQDYLPAIGEKLPTHIKKGHQLVFSRQDLSAREADMFALMMAHMSPEDWVNDTPVYAFSAQQLSEWLGINSKHVGYTLDPVAERLSFRKVGIKVTADNGDQEFDHVPYFKRIRYKNRKLIMIPNDELKSEYIEYKQGFALINTRNFFTLKKEYSKRLYELLSRFKTDGTSMQRQSLKELKGLFGLLDEKGQLKSDKSSFKNTSVFLTRCIKNSIKEISENPQTRKELLFLESENGELGFKAIRKGRSIVAIEFLYKWLEKGTVHELNVQSAKETIRELEMKRLQNSVRLSTEELQLLVAAYHAVGKLGKAAPVEESIRQRSIHPAQTEEAETDIDAMLDKIESLQEVSGNPCY